MYKPIDDVAEEPESYRDLDGFNSFPVNSSGDMAYRWGRLFDSPYGEIVWYLSFDPSGNDWYLGIELES